MSNQKSYVVCVSVDGYVEVEVKAESPEEASKIARNKVSEFDFGPLRGVEWSTLKISAREFSVIYIRDESAVFL